MVRSGRELTYSPGKDTGRYWDAGAVNVHWVIATDQQVAAGIQSALGRVTAGGVFIEGNSFTEYIDTDFFVMVVRPDDSRIKATARTALRRVSAFYVSGDANTAKPAHIGAALGQISSRGIDRALPVFTPRSLPELITCLRELTNRKATANGQFGTRL